MTQDPRRESRVALGPETVQLGYLVVMSVVASYAVSGQNIAAYRICVPPTNVPENGFSQELGGLRISRFHFHKINSK